MEVKDKIKNYHIFSSNLCLYRRIYRLKIRNIIGLIKLPRKE